jgi:hypothetical protein
MIVRGFKQRCGGGMQWNVKMNPPFGQVFRGDILGLVSGHGTDGW